MTKAMATMPVGIVIERRELDNPWQDYDWVPVALMPGVETDSVWKRVDEGEGWVRYLAATLDLELFPRETEGYKVNLSQEPPVVFVVLRSLDDEDEDDEGAGAEVSDDDVVPEVTAFHLTVCPYEAGAYLESGDEIVEGIRMPEEIFTWLQDFVEEHHVDQVFKKRKRNDDERERDGGSRRKGLDGPLGPRGPRGPESVH